MTRWTLALCRGLGSTVALENRAGRVLLVAGLALGWTAAHGYASSALALAQDRPAGSATADEQYRYFSALCENKHWDLAIKEGRAFLSAHAGHPKAVLARYRLAGALFETGKVSEAQIEYERLAPDASFEFRPEVLFRLGQCHQRTAQWNLGAEAFAAARQTQKPYLQRPSTFFQAECLFALEEFAKAERLYSELAQPSEGLPEGVDPKEYSREARLAVCWCALRQNNFDATCERAQSYRRDFSADPSAQEAAFLSGEAHLSAGRFEPALEQYAAVQAGAHHAAAMRGRGFALAGLARHGEAADAFSQTLERFPEGSHVAEVALQRGIERLLAGDAQGAVRDLVDTRAGAGAETSFWLAKAQLARADASAALAAAERGLAASPDEAQRARLLALRGDALIALGRGSEALGAFESAGSEYALHAAAVAAFNAGENAKACAFARDFLQRYASSERAGAVQLILGEALLAEREFGLAASTLAQLAQVAPPGFERARVLERLGWARFLGSEWAAAAESFGAVATQHASSPQASEAVHMLGRALEKLGDTAGSARAMEQYLANYPDGQRAGESAWALVRLAPSATAGDQLQRQLERATSSKADPAAVSDRSWIAEGWMSLGEYHQSQKQGPQAQRAFAAALAEFSSATRADQRARASAAQYALAFAQFEAGDWAKARAGAQAAASDPDCAAALRVFALELDLFAAAKAGDAAAAASAWQTFAAACAEDPRRLVALQAALAPLREQREYTKGLELCRSLAGSASDSAVVESALVESAWLCMDNQDLPGAASALARVSRAQGSKAEALFFLGEAHYAKAEYEQSGPIYDQVVALAQAVTADDLAAKALYKRGFVAIQAKDWKSAASSFEALTTRYPAHELGGESLFLLGEARYRAGDLEHCASALEALLHKHPQHATVPKALFRLAVARGELKQFPAVEASLAKLRAHMEVAADQAAQKSIAWGEVDLWQGRALAARDDARAARTAFERVLEREKGLLAAQARVELGKLLLRGGDAEAALSEFLKVSLLFEDGAEVAEALLHSGMCLEKLGDAGRAKEQYRAVISRFGSSTQAQQASERLAAMDKVQDA